MSPLSRARYALLLLSTLCTAWPALPAERPHIVYVTVDDLGWKDVGYHGSTIQTPTIDRLAASGARLEQFYVQPFSSQTRAAVMTGRYPMRYGFQTMQLQWNSQFGLPADERLLPKVLKEAGYRTVLLGKWQLGHAHTEMRPTHRGFDQFYGHLTGEIDYFKKTNRGGEHDWWQDDKPLKERGYVTSLLAQRAVKLIAGHDPKVPLFLWLSFAAPQAPHQAPAQWLERYADVADPRQRAYRAMVGAVDAAVADVMAALEARGMGADTLLLFHSTTTGVLPTKFAMGDGDTDAAVASNGPYRGGRGSLYEGGLRAVAFAVWPEHIQPAVVTEMVHAVDLYPTLLQVAGANASALKPLDGVDQWQALSAGQPSARREVLLDVEDFRGAIRIGDWKLIRIATLPSRSELYNLRADPSEEDDQADREPARLEALTKRLMELAWEMAPSKYLEDLSHPHRAAMPIYWGENPVRP